MPMYTFRCPECNSTEDRILPINSDKIIMCLHKGKRGKDSVLYVMQKIITSPPSVHYKAKGFTGAQRNER